MFWKRKKNIVDELNQYDHSILKADEIEFVRKLEKQYDQNKATVLRRIRETRRLMRYNRNKGGSYMIF